MLRWADAMEKKADALARLLTAESDNRWRVARGDRRLHLGNPLLCGHHALFRACVRGGAGRLFHPAEEPASIAGLIIPWNAPAVLLIRAR